MAAEGGFIAYMLLVLFGPTSDVVDVHVPSGDAFGASVRRSS